MWARFLGVLAIAACGVTPVTGHAATRYHVRLMTASGNVARLAFDFTCNDSSANKVTILTLTHNGTTGVVNLIGGPINGDILSGGNHADTSSIEAGAFFSEVSLPFVSLGTHVDYDLELTENAPGSGRPEDEFAFYFLPRADSLPYPTADPLGTNALFAIAATGAAGGDLSVFSPMTFVAPDTLLLDGSLLDAPWTSETSERLRFSGVFPNPSTATVRFDYIVPTPSGIIDLKIFDAAGRVVAEPLRAWQPPGKGSVIWQGAGRHGSPAAPGVYLAQLSLGGQSIVRRVVLTR